MSSHNILVWLASLFGSPDPTFRRFLTGVFTCIHIYWNYGYSIKYFILYIKYKVELTDMCEDVKVSSSEILIETK